MTIFGTVDDVGAFENLASAVEIDGCGPDWRGGGLTAYGAASVMIDAVKKGKPFEVFCVDDPSPFESLIALCRGYGLPYRIQSGDAGGSRLDTLEYWTPGMEERTMITSDSDDDHPVRLFELKKAFSEGVEAVRELIERFEAINGIFEGKGFEVDEGVIADWRENYKRTNMERAASRRAP